MLRIAEERDIPAMLDIYAPYILTTTYTFEYDVPCLRTFTQRFCDITAQFPWLVWEEKGEILGYAYASPPYTRAAYRWCAEVSAYIRPEAHGRGIGRQLYDALEQLLWRQGYQVIYALISTENTGSVAFIAFAKEALAKIKSSSIRVSMLYFKSSVCTAACAESSARIFSISLASFNISSLSSLFNFTTAAGSINTVDPFADWS